MDIYWYGQACFKLKGKQASVIIDPFDLEFTGLKLPKDMEANIAIKTHDHLDHSNLGAVTGDPIKIAGPGEYEISAVTVNGVSVFHDKSKGSERGLNTVYNIEIDGLNVVHLGDLGHVLEEEQVAQIGLTDILLIPVGSIYTISAEEATQVVSQLEPKIIIPMHYWIDGLKFPLDKVELFLKQMGKEGIEPISKFSITKEKLPDEPQVVVLNKS
ncbi:MBL fold metallo-hydrolase [Candidatus Daviesbacteria bacterium]|nr:MBL fold metallo-hydrolase [Candidatus Daviesbacteria bacterium]